MSLTVKLSGQASAENVPDPPAVERLAAILEYLNDRGASESVLKTYNGIRSNKISQAVNQEDSV